jgi:YHS domain-containing protein
MNRNIRSIALMAALAVILVIGVLAQQKSADTAIDPVCGMTVVKTNAKATFDYKGTTYYFCSTGCKESFAKEPEKYLKAQQAKAGEAAAPAQKGHMGMMEHAESMGQAPKAEAETMAGQDMMAHRMAMGGRMGRMPMMRGGMGMPGRGGMGPGMGPLFFLHGADVEVTVENTKDGAILKVTSKDPETVKAIQVHMSEHVAMMKKMKEAAAKAPESEACANCPMKTAKK